MAIRSGAFDRETVAAAWFARDALAGSWFTDEMIPSPATTTYATGSGVVTISVAVAGVIAAVGVPLQDGARTREVTPSMRVSEANGLIVATASQHLRVREESRN